MALNKLILLRSDNGEVNINITHDDLTQKLRQVTNWKVTKKEPCLVARLFKCGTAEFNQVCRKIARISK